MKTFTSACIVVLVLSLNFEISLQRLVARAPENLVQGGASYANYMKKRQESSPKSSSVGGDDPSKSSSTVSPLFAEGKRRIANFLQKIKSAGGSGLGSGSSASAPPPGGASQGAGESGGKTDEDSGGKGGGKGDSSSTKPPKWKS
ncbi:hypothetical protein O181_064624, partial [Austropuccinia psidii MF-1]|nr:hypothetical protein [Austropuccinia psidii MF-1]